MSAVCTLHMGDVAEDRSPEDAKIEVLWVMVIYENERLKKSVRTHTLCAFFVLLVFGFGVCGSLWFGYFDGVTDDISIWEIILINLVIAFGFFSFFRISCALCPQVHATEQGLSVKTCIFFWFSILWEDIEDCIIRMGSERYGPEGVSATLQLRKGLTPMHYLRVRKGQGRGQWIRGIILVYSGGNYKQLVQYIQAKIA